MRSTIGKKYDFVPTASIVAFVFIGIFIIICVIGRCLALNRSTVRNTQNLDLMIYRVPPKQSLSHIKIRLSTDLLYDGDNNRKQHVLLFDDQIHVQRGPKNL